MKRLKRLFVLFLLLIVIVVGGVVYYSDSIVREAMEQAGTASLGVDTTVGNVDLGWVRDSCEFNDIVVANPEGFRSETFLSVGRISLAQAVPSFLSDAIVIPRLEIADISIFLETDGSNTNFGPIIQSIQGVNRVEEDPDESDSSSAAPSDSETSESSPSSSSSDGGGKQLTIEKLVITNLHVSCLVRTLLGEAVPVEIDIPEIELDNLRSDDTKGTLADNVGSIVLTVLSVVQQTVRSQLPAAIARSLTTSLDGLAAKIPMLGGLTEELAVKAAPIAEQIKVLSQGAETVHDVIKGAAEDLPQSVDSIEDAKKEAEKVAEKAKKALRGLLGGGR